MPPDRSKTVPRTAARRWQHLLATGVAITVSTLALSLVFLAPLTHLGAQAQTKAPDQGIPIRPAGEPVLSLKPPAGIDSRKAALGERLFEEKALSGNQEWSCTTCHPLESGGMDERPRPPGPAGSPLSRNTPTIFNVGLIDKLGWLGNVTSLEKATEAILKAPNRLASKWSIIIPRLQQMEDYRQAFAALYPDGIQPANVLDALAVFQRSLTTPDAPFDRYLQGEAGAIAPQAQRGYKQFKSHGCSACHQGQLLGANLFSRLGIFSNYFAEPVQLDNTDLGRLVITGQESDRFVFRVPGLRNVDLTPPYFHDGRVADLETAVITMGKLQLGYQMETDEVADIAAFLNTLTGIYRRVHRE